MHNEDETTAFWMDHSKEKLAETVAVLTRDRRISAEKEAGREVDYVRKAIAAAFAFGKGFEVGGGDRPWPLPESAQCVHGDRLNLAGLHKYFGAHDMLSKIKLDRQIDAETLDGVPDNQLDFFVTGHVIEHLSDPIGSIRNAIRVLKPSGVYILAVPDMRYTFDKGRPMTTLEHLLKDEREGGMTTREQSYEEVVRLGYPNATEAEVKIHVHHGIKNRIDIHWHTWTAESFRAMLDATSSRLGFSVAFQTAVQNETIVVLKKNTAPCSKPATIANVADYVEPEDSLALRTAGTVKPRLLQIITESKASGLTFEEIIERTWFKSDSVRGALSGLQNEKAITKDGDKWFLAEFI